MQVFFTLFIVSKGNCFFNLNSKNKIDFQFMMKSYYNSEISLFKIELHINGAIKVGKWFGRNG